jgi:hypothetical protein
VTAGRGDPQLQFVSLNMEVSGDATALQGGSDPVQPPYGTLCVSSAIMRFLVAHDKVLRRTLGNWVNENEGGSPYDYAHARESAESTMRNALLTRVKRRGRQRNATVR